MTNRQNQNVLSLIQSIESLNAQAQGEAGAIETLFTETPTYRSNKAPSLVQQLAQNAAHLEGTSDTSNIKNLPKASIILSSQDKDETDGQDDFDEKLSKLMRDVQYQDDNRPAEKNLSRNHQQFQKKTPYLDTHASADPDIRSEIDALLAPYLDTQRPLTASATKTYASSEPASIETQKTEHNRESIIDKESLIELRLFIRNEMKRQVTLWIEQNIDKIIQDALLSATPKARNAEDTPNKASVK